MINKKEILWSILSKYDGISNLKSFCDGISKFIQNNQCGEDIINIFKSLKDIDVCDKFKLNQVIGNEIDSFLFSL